MKKTLCGILGALATISCANALPAVDSVEDVCITHPDKYVKLQNGACIPVDPCHSSIKEYKDAYCLNLDSLPLYRDGDEFGYPIARFDKTKIHNDNVDILLEEYIEKKLNTSIDGNAAYRDFSWSDEAKETDYVVGYRLTNGSYMAFMFKKVNLHNDYNKAKVWKTATWAFGKEPENSNECDELADFMGDYVVRLCKGVWTAAGVCDITCEK